MQTESARDQQTGDTLRKKRQGFARAYARSKKTARPARADLRNKNDPMRRLCRHRYSLPDGTHRRCSKPATVTGYCKDPA